MPPSFAPPLDSRQANSDRGERPHFKLEKVKKLERKRGWIGTNLSRGGGRKIGRRRRTNTFPTQKEKKARKLPLDDKGARKGKKERNGCWRFWFGPSRLLYPPFRFLHVLPIPPPPEITAMPVGGPPLTHSRGGYARPNQPQTAKRRGGGGGRPIHGFFSFLFRLFLAP